MRSHKYFEYYTGSKIKEKFWIFRAILFTNMVNILNTYEKILELFFFLDFNLV